ncbi:hypothetical protein EJ06DRAFT_528918 [Trichodelitschia bisporula]|uniref:N-acetylgalactosaminide beta-1,3-galactosyltransferase n=1 Tax=Trichodelitschia bisporula TaxID=703511 RepID=A0A6G1I0I0_9PEZI|nr:hypothetical protein EJ06DRAFT_528918 [Trichodelitschia bisporula]
MNGLTALLRPRGPFQGPRLLSAIVVIALFLFFLNQPYSSTERRVPDLRPENQPGTNPAAAPTAGKPTANQGAPDAPAKDASMSDKLLEYIKGANAASKNEPAKGHAAVAAPTAGNDTQTHVDPACAHLPDTSDVLVVMRSPAAELYKLMPAHFMTDLACAPFELFSTVGIDIGPYKVHDTIAGISERRRAQHKDFELYEKIKNAQVAAQDLATLVEDSEHNLDRWTILPALLQAYKLHPQKKWFVLVESDTYLSMANLMPWLAKLDSSQPIYAGAQVLINDIELAHSGSGMLISGAAVKKLAALADERMEVWEEAVGHTCCGDKILSMAFSEAGVRLTRAFPMLQGETPFSLDWSNRHWCRAATTWHRMTPASIDLLWQFERAWQGKHRDEANPPPMLFRDYFTTFVLSVVRAAPNRTDWDNLSESWTITDDTKFGQYAYYSAEACRAACELREPCVQFAWEPGKCRLGKEVRMGELVKAERRMESGWLMHRVERLMSSQQGCAGVQPWEVERSAPVGSKLVFDTGAKKIEVPEPKKAEGTKVEPNKEEPKMEEEKKEEPKQEESKEAEKKEGNQEEEQKHESSQDGETNEEEHKESNDKEESKSEPSIANIEMGSGGKEYEGTPESNGVIGKDEVGTSSTQ